MRNSQRLKNQREKKKKLKATDQNIYKHSSILADQVWEEDDSLGGTNLGYMMRNTFRWFFLMGMYLIFSFEHRQY